MSKNATEMVFITAGGLNIMAILQDSMVVVAEVRVSDRDVPQKLMKSSSFYTKARASSSQGKLVILALLHFLYVSVIISRKEK